MSIFHLKRKTKNLVSQPTTQTAQKEVCDHKWKDFDWIITYNDFPENGYVEYVIKEPYVCIHCKERKDVILETGRFPARGYNEVKDKIEKICEKYPKISSIAVVQDQIYDMQLVDREYLKIAAMVMGVKP